MKKINIFFVSLISIAVLAGNAFCAKEQNNIQDLKLKIASFAKEDIISLTTVLSQEKKHTDTIEQIRIKLERVKKQYPDSARTIDKVFNAIRDIMDVKASLPEVKGQSYITPLSDYLLPALRELRTQNSGVFYATMSVIDIKYPISGLSESLFEIIDFTNWNTPESVSVVDPDDFASALKADSKKDALWMFEYLMKKEPEVKNTTEIVMQRFKCVVSNYNKENFVSKDWAQTAEGCLEDLASLLATVNTLNPRLYGKVMGIMNRKYPAINGYNYSISEFKDFVNEKVRFCILDDSGLVFDEYGILDKLNAYEK